MKLIYTSDTHSFLFPAMYTEKGEHSLGLMRIAESYRKDKDTVVIDGGDTLQGSALAKYVSDKTIRPFPQAAIFREAGLDIAVPGNHDFNYGYDTFSDFFTETGAEILCANLIDKTGKLNIRKHIIKEDPDGLRVAFVGAVTEFVNIWESSRNLENFEILPVFDSVKAELEAVKDKADYTVLIYHGGFECDIRTGEKLSDTSENQAYRICSELGYDIVLSAHQHMAIPFSKCGNSYIIQCPPNGSMFAEICLKKDSVEGCLRKPDENGPKLLERKYSSLDKKINDWLDEVVAEIDEAIPAPSVIDSTMNGSRIADFFNYVQLETSGADISCTALANQLFGFDKEISIRQVIANYQYPNTLTVIELNESEIRKALERAASFFDIEDGRPVISKRFLEPKVELYNYDYYLGLSYTFDISKPVGERVVRLLYQGKPIGDRSLKLCLNGYRASGAGGYDVFRGKKPLRLLNLDVQDLAVEYLLKHRDCLRWPKADFMTICSL